MSFLDNSAHLTTLRIYPLLKSILSDVQMNTWQQRIEDHISCFSRFNVHWLTRGLFTPAFQMNRKWRVTREGGPAIGELTCDVNYYYQGQKQETDKTKKPWAFVCVDKTRARSSVRNSFIFAKTGSFDLHFVPATWKKCGNFERDQYCGVYEKCLKKDTCL